MSKSIVLLPSVRRNRGLDGYVEGEGMRIVAWLARDMLLEAPGIEVEIFWPGYEEGPGHAMLRRQQTQAETWLRARPGPHAHKCTLYLRSGCGAQRRVLGIHGAGEHDARWRSRALASMVAAEVGRAMDIRTVRVTHHLEGWDTDGFDPEHPFAWALVECGSHDSVRDAQLLGDTPEVVAQAVADGVLAYLASQRPKPGATWRRGRLKVSAAGAIARTAPTRSGSVLRALGPTVLATDGYTECGQKLAGSSRWYHLARESGYGWVHSSAGRYQADK